MNVVVGNLQYPAVVSQAVSNKLAVSQDLETRATQVEIARKDAERRVVEAEGIARATQIIQQRLTPLYVQHEAIEAQKALVGSPNHSVIYIPVGPMGVPVVSTLPSAGREALRGRVRAPRGMRPPMSTPVYMHTLGCPKNRVDSEIMLGTLTQAGYRLVQDPARADVIVVNTCGFIESAKEESVQAILELSRMKEEGRCKKLVVAGCLTQRYPDEMAREMPEVDHFVGTGAYADIASIVSDAQAKRVIVPDPDFVHSASTPPDQLAGPPHGLPQDRRGLRQRLRLLHHPEAARRRSARAPSTTWWPRPRRWPPRAWSSCRSWPRTSPPTARTSPARCGSTTCSPSSARSRASAGSGCTTPTRATSPTRSSTSSPGSPRSPSTWTCRSSTPRTGCSAP